MSDPASDLVGDAVSHTRAGAETGVEDLLRRLAPQVLGAVARRYGNFAAAEDAVQEALLAGFKQWPRDGLPENPRAWLIKIAARRLTDLLRAEQARRRRELAAGQAQPEPWYAPAVDEQPTDHDDTLTLLFLCCHSSLTASSRIALTLRAVGGLSTTEIARAFLVPETTMTRRISRAKQRIKDSGAPFAMPPRAEHPERLESVQHVLYLIFNEGYASTSGPTLSRSDLCAEAIRLTRMLCKATSHDAESSGLLALMLLTDARRPARAAADGAPIPMHLQDRSLWNTDRITEGVALLTDAMTRGPAGPYQVQAAIAALHDEAPTAEETDWAQIVALYEVLMTTSDNPVVALNHAVAVAMHRGPQAGLDLLHTLARDDRVAQDHRLYAARAHLLEMLNRTADARAAYRTAAQRTTNLQQQRYLYSRAARLEK